MTPRDGEFPPPPAPQKAFARGATFVTLHPTLKLRAPRPARLHKAVCDRIENYRCIHNNGRFRVGASIGLVPLDCRWSTSAALMQAAHTACYDAKEAGRNRVHQWLDSDQLMQARQGEINWVARLEEPLAEQRFRLYGQRIVPCNGAPSGLHLEVLAAPGRSRWNDHHAGRIDTIRSLKIGGSWLVRDC